MMKLKRWFLMALVYCYSGAMSAPVYASSSGEVGWRGLECLLALDWSSQEEPRYVAASRCGSLTLLPAGVVRSWSVHPSKWTHWKDVVCLDTPVFCEAGRLVEENRSLQDVAPNRRIRTAVALAVILAASPDVLRESLSLLSHEERQSVALVTKPIDWWLKALGSTEPSKAVLSSLESADSTRIGVEALAPLLQLVDRDGLQRELKALLQSVETPEACRKLRKVWVWAAPTLQPPSGTIENAKAQQCLGVKHSGYGRGGIRPMTLPTAMTFRVDVVASMLLGAVR